MFVVNVLFLMFISKFSIRNMLLYCILGNLIYFFLISVYIGYKGLVMYVVIKGVLEVFFKNMVWEWGSKGIRFNCIVVGFMEIDMMVFLI